MILYVSGDLFQSPAQVLVNTVNTVGVMGKGIALQFKQLYPEMFQQYRDLCEQNKFDIGMLWLYKSRNKWVLNFPTKKHWRQPSRLEYIEAGLKKFVSAYTRLSVHSIAFPALGCGNGQLDFSHQVQPLMERYLKNLPIDVFIYPESKNQFIEHLAIDEMMKWLRTEPSSLAFSEVWEDLKAIIARNPKFETVSRNATFTVDIDEQADTMHLNIKAEQCEYHLSYDVLLHFWQQLRSHGYTMRKIAPSLDYEVSYLIPIFSRLDYVMPVQVADDYSEFHKAETTGLQILPEAFTQRISVPATQLSMF